MVTISPGATGPPLKLAALRIPPGTIAGLAVPWTTVNDTSFDIFTVPVRSDPLKFGVSVKSTAPLPLTLEKPEIAIQGSGEVGVH